MFILTYCKYLNPLGLEALGIQSSILTRQDVNPKSGIICEICDCHTDPTLLTPYNDPKIITMQSLLEPNSDPDKNIPFTYIGN